MNTTTPYKIVKLTNGENLICQINDDIDNGEYKINFPLKMEIHSLMTKEGPVDSLNLSRWVGPFTDQSRFLIKSDHVLLVANASEGLCRFYEHTMKEIKQVDTPEKRALLDDLNDELLEEVEISNTSNKTVH